MNPYESPESEECDSNKPASDAEPRRIRWRLIPAVISWLIGGLGLAALPFGIANNLDTFSFSTDQAIVWILLDVLFLLTPVLFCGVCICYVAAGFRWMNRRWISAIVLTLVPYLSMLAFVAGVDWLREFALNSI
ncbi:MAG: hypothetical protein AAF483_04270 [Planctomycetota bacterium]